MYTSEIFKWTLPSYLIQVVLSAQNKVYRKKIYMCVPSVKHYTNKYHLAKNFCINYCINYCKSIEFSGYKI